MVNAYCLALLLFFQDEAGPSRFFIEYATLYLWLAFAFFGGLFAGIILAFIFFNLKPKNQNSISDNQNLKLSEPDKTIQVGAIIKHCPQCNSTYTDEDLNYCLRDGAVLKNVGFMPASDDPDKTLVRSK